MRASTSSAVSSVPGLKWRITTEKDELYRESFLSVTGFREYWDFFQGNNGIATAYILPSTGIRNGNCKADGKR